ncbi:MAG: RsmD family RNA methyltransferase [Holophaga sp.]|nr:RsmD family RNA methyltransferase [Holophaga sp.]
MRIIAGAIRGRRLDSPAEGELGIRPTSDRAREALFSILQAWPKGAFLDLFAGTGAVGVEAWSRGYSPVVCVEKDPKTCLLAQRNSRGSEVQVVRQDALRLKHDSFKGLDFVFADPPYEGSGVCFERLAPIIRSWLRKDGLLIWETEKRTELPILEGFLAMDSRQYGAARFHFFKAG